METAVAQNIKRQVCYLIHDFKGHCEPLRITWGIICISLIRIINERISLERYSKSQLFHHSPKLKIHSFIIACMLYLMDYR